jgi:hypothetical protein
MATAPDLKHYRRWKACFFCGGQFEIKHADSRFCLTCQSSSKRKRAKSLPRLSGDNRLVFYRPRSLRTALTALERKVPIEALVLSDTEKDVLVASYVRLPIEDRLDAAGRLVATCAPWLTGRTLKLQLGGTRVNGERAKARAEFLVLLALEAACDETISFGVWKRRLGAPRRVGGRRRVAPYVPADDLWWLLLHDFLPSELGRLLRPFEDEQRRYHNLEDAFNRRGGLRLEGPAGKDEDDKTRNLEDVVGITPDGEIFWTKPSGAGWFKYVQANRRPSAAYFEALRFTLPIGGLTNPPLDRWEMEGLRGELKGSRSPLRLDFARYESEAKFDCLDDDGDLIEDAGEPLPYFNQDDAIPEECLQ